VRAGTTFVILGGAGFVTTILYTALVFWPGRGVLPDERTSRVAPAIVNRSLVRQTHLLMFLGSTLLLTIGTRPAAGTASGPAFRVSQWVFLVTALGVAGQFFLNRPRVLVPRRYRHEPGFIADCWLRIRGRPAPDPHPRPRGRTTPVARRRHPVVTTTDGLHIRANRTQGDRAVGGHLTVSSSRVAFEPHSYDRERGGEAWSASLADVAAIGRKRRTWNPWDGGIRTRLELVMRDGHSELFVVPHLDNVVAELNRRVSSS
jgi:hypothetical protein